MMAVACSLFGISVAANIVIAERTAGMMGFREHAPDENARMISEKVEAVYDSVIGSWASACRGDALDQVFMTALAPVSAKVVDNAHRLTQS